jgi:hypothetical protein
MSKIQDTAVMDAISTLRELSDKNLAPNEAKVAIKSLRDRYPDLVIQVVFEEDEFALSTHYDFLLSTADGATLSLSFAKAPAVPWPLRGMHRWSESHLASVNGVLVRMQHAVACLDFLWHDSAVGTTRQCNADLWTRT